MSKLPSRKHTTCQMSWNFFYHILWRIPFRRRESDPTNALCIPIQVVRHEIRDVLIPCASDSEETASCASPEKATRVCLCESTGNFDCLKHPPRLRARSCCWGVRSRAEQLGCSGCSWGGRRLPASAAGSMPCSSGRTSSHCSPAASSGLVRLFRCGRPRRPACLDSRCCSKHRCLGVPLGLCLEVSARGCQGMLLNLEPTSVAPTCQESAVAS